MYTLHIWVVPGDIYSLQKGTLYGLRSFKRIMLSILAAHQDFKLAATSTPTLLDALLKQVHKTHLVESRYISMWAKKKLKNARIRLGNNREIGVTANLKSYWLKWACTYLSLSYICNEEPWLLVLDALNISSMVCGLLCSAELNVVMWLHNQATQQMGTQHSLPFKLSTIFWKNNGKSWLWCAKLF